MKSTNTIGSINRLEALMNFLQNYPKYLPSDFKLGIRGGDRQMCLSGQTLTDNTTHDFSQEISHIRYTAISAIMTKHNLNFSQIMALTISDIDLEEKVCAIKHKDGTVAYWFAMSDDIVQLISTYLRVRPPTKADKLFPCHFV